MKMYPTCPSCGQPQEPRFSERGTPAQYHVPRGDLCKLRAWELEVHRLELFRVNGYVSECIGEQVPRVYGPYLLTEEQIERDNSVLSEFEQHTYLKPGIVVARFVPRWAAVLGEAFGKFWGPDKTSAFASARTDTSFQVAVLSVADLSPDPAARRRAVMQFCALTREEGGEK